jgi:hypothetical protein
LPSLVAMNAAPNQIEAVVQGELIHSLTMTRCAHRVGGEHGAKEEPTGE